MISSARSVLVQPAPERLSREEIEAASARRPMGSLVPSLLRGAGIYGIGSYLPERVLTNADLEKMVETSDEWIVTRTGIEERRIAREGGASWGMGGRAGRRG